MRDAPPPGFAALWERWNKGEIERFAIVTGEPNSLAATIHNRMPAILRIAWLTAPTP